MGWLYRLLVWVLLLSDIGEASGPRTLPFVVLPSPLSLLLRYRNSGLRSTVTSVKFDPKESGCRLFRDYVSKTVFDLLPRRRTEPASRDVCGKWGDVYGFRPRIRDGSLSGHPTSTAPTEPKRDGGGGGDTCLVWTSEVDGRFVDRPRPVFPTTPIEEVDGD